VEQLLPDLLLQPVDAGGDGGGRHVQPLRRGDEASGLDDIEKGAQLFEVHGIGL